MEYFNFPVNLINSSVNGILIFVGAILVFIFIVIVYRFCISVMNFNKVDNSCTSKEWRRSIRLGQRAFQKEYGKDKYSYFPSKYDDDYYGYFR